MIVSRKIITNSDKILNQIKEAYGFKTDTALAKYLEVGQSTLAMWRKRGRANLNLIITKCDNIGLGVFPSRSPESGKNPPSSTQTFAESDGKSDNSQSKNLHGEGEDFILMEFIDLQKKVIELQDERDRLKGRIAELEVEVNLFKNQEEKKTG